MATPWLRHYDPGVPATLAPYPGRTLVDYVAHWARERPDSPAILFKGATLTYADLERLSDAFADALAELGVGPGSHVGLLLPNCPQFVIAELGAWKRGAIVAPVNPTYTEPELAAAIADNAVDTIVTLTRFYGRVKRVQPGTRLTRVIATNIKEYFPPLLRLLFTIARERKDGDRVRLAPGDHHFKALLARGAASDRAPLTGDDPAVLLLSGGTTGTPKGVLGSHRAYTLTGLQIQAWMASILEGGRDVILLPLPLFHVYGNVGVQSLAFVTGSPLALVPNPRDLPDLLATIRRVKPAFFNGVPTLYAALLNHADVRAGKVDFTSIKICFSGSSALMADTKRRFEALTGGRIVEGYSLTEAMMALAVNPVQGPNKIGSVGMPLPDVHIRIVDGDEGVREIAAGEVGEICFAAPQLMIGFWQRADETADALRDHPPDSSSPGDPGSPGNAEGHDAGARRWLHTGDLGYLDDDGYLFIVDRKKDLIKTSGFQVWPREVEEVLTSHPAVLEAGVAGVPDDLKGEAVGAWVVLETGGQATEDELRAYCRERLAPYKIPSRVIFRAELPKTMVGKVLRRALRDGVV